MDVESLGWLGRLLSSGGVLLCRYVVALAALDEREAVVGFMLHQSCIMDSRTILQNPVCCLIEPLPYAETWERGVEHRQGGGILRTKHRNHQNHSSEKTLR